ncbi:MAG TPA: RNA 2',3'-cyclic phosphodiesterase [Candidatus Omnitrophica bacterium]|nr:RNA 2',3'-cyclic phosphodiesterase [Candidatus Omnitrophota bacterium]
MRAFLAVELPADIRRSLADLQSQLAKTRADVKWTEEENLHITMRFLGEITGPQRQGLEEMLRRAASRHHATTVQLDGLGAFPSVDSPRVLWVGIREGQEELTKIAQEIEQGVTALGLPKEDHQFSAHVTLGRVRSPKHRAQLVAAMRAVTWTRPEPFMATHLTLFQSTLTSAGARYTPLVKFPYSIKK